MTMPIIITIPTKLNPKSKPINIENQDHNLSHNRGHPVAPPSAPQSSRTSWRHIGLQGCPACTLQVKGIDVASKVIRQLEEEVGSYALMASTGFEHKDMLLCCRFAEGDSV